MLIVLAGLFFSCHPANEPPRKAQINYEWANNKLWDDGSAEVATYEATRTIYGEPRLFEYTYILVKEEFNQTYNVKTDDYQVKNLYPVMKINKFCSIETPNYPYHFLSSIFIYRNNPENLHKLTHTSQEWCGNTSKSFLEKGNGYRFEYNSYFDGQGKGSAKVGRGPWFEDQLSYTLRSVNFSEGLSFDINLYPSQISNKAIVPEAETAKISVNKADNSDLEGIPTSFIDSAWEVKVTKEGGDLITFWINSSYPNYLLRMEDSSGNSLKLKDVTRDQYWVIK